jgi:diphosphomevalonate decarboxylase
MTTLATARACANIAFIKYWGNRNHELRLPANGSLSMNLDGLHTTTTVRFDTRLKADRLTLDAHPVNGPALARVSTHLDHVRRLAGSETRAEVVSENNFPMGAGIASSASAFAALTVAACAAAGLTPSERELTTLARLGSGSASRSVPGGFVEWYASEDHETSYAESIAPPEHWALIDLVAIVSEEHKAVGSTGGHRLAETSPLQGARVEDAPRRLKACREALLKRDFEAFTQAVEDDVLQMHAVMMTSHPALFYWQPDTLRVMQAVRQWREDGHAVCFTIDAGPNVHILCPADEAERVEGLLRATDGVQRVLRATPGGPAVLVD